MSSLRTVSCYSRSYKCDNAIHVWLLTFDHRVSSGRAFNTTRTLKRPNDNSTVDLAFLPTMNFDEQTIQAFKVPILPDHYRDGSKTAERITLVSVPTPEVSTASMAHESQLSVLGESHDSGKHAEEQMDVFGLVEGVGTKVKQEVEAEVGVLRQVWGDLMDDILGKKTAKS